MTAVTLLGLPPQLDADARILIVDSEAAGQRAAALLPSYRVLWPSEAGSLHELSMEAWIPLQGCDVLLWPSNIPACRDSMASAGNALQRVTDRVRMIYVNGAEPAYFSAADMGEDWDNRRVVAWAKERVRAFEAPPPAPDPMEALDAAAADVSHETIDPQDIHREDGQQPPTDADLPSKRVRRGKPRTKPNGQPPDGVQIEAKSAFTYWETLGLDRLGNHAPFPNIANAALIIASHPDITGRIWYDEFHQRIFSTLFSPDPEEWRDDHDTRLLITLQRDLKLAKMGIQSVQRGVEMVARMHVRNEPREWFDALKWDGTPRLSHFMADAFGAPHDEYHAKIAIAWFVSMPARIYEPGCKVDYMPVFEGWQGLKKTSALEAIGGKWFAELHEDINKKDFFLALNGKMIVEFTELHAFTESNIERIKGIITCRTDRYRAPFERRTADHPRMSVFAGTTNRTEWVGDPTGARRMWPVACKSVNLDYIRSNREQLFAEAVATYKKSPVGATADQRIAAGSSWWDIPHDLAKDQQDDRRVLHPWFSAVEKWTEGRDGFTLEELFEFAVPLPLQDRTMVDQKNMGAILRILGFESRVARRLGKLNKRWFRTGNTGNEELDL